MIRLALYLAFGLVFHVIFVGAQLDATNAWTWIWVLLWPIPLVLIGAMIGVVFLVGTMVVAAFGGLRR